MGHENLLVREEVGLGSFEDGLDLLYHQVGLTVRFLVMNPTGSTVQCSALHFSEVCAAQYSAVQYSVVQ